MTRFFTGVMERQMRRSFRAVRMLRPGLPQVPDDTPLVVYANHPGWWDPAFFIVLQGRVLRREGYGPIDAEALAKYRFMARMGLFGVAPGTRAGAVRFLRVGTQVVSDPRRCLWMTAQGRFADPRERPVDLRAGLAHLLARVPGAVALPLALEYPFWSEKRPEALCHFGPPVPATDGAEALHDRLGAALEAAQDRLAGAALARDPAAFETILGGRRGVGGIYAAWSRLRAAGGGARYDPDHLPDPPDTTR